MHFWHECPFNASLAKVSAKKFRTSSFLLFKGSKHLEGDVSRDVNEIARIELRDEINEYLKEYGVRVTNKKQELTTLDDR